MPSALSNSVQTSQEEANKPSSSSSSPKSASSLCSSPGEETHNNSINTFKTESTIEDHINSLTKLVPTVIEAASSTTLKKSITSSNIQEYCYREDDVLPPELKSRLHTIFNQIEREFDSLFAENTRLQRNFIKNQKNTLNHTSPIKLLPNHSQKEIKSPNKHVLEKSNSQPSSILNSMMANMTSNKFSEKSNNTNSNTKPANFLSSKTRTNLSFPKFRPNARGSIMQSIKNTSAQIVNKTQNNSSYLSSKLQCTLNSHKDGIWDINCVPIPSHLFNNNNSNHLSGYTNNDNLLIGTASADTTARLWYLNSHSSQSNNQIQTTVNQLSPSLANQPQQLNNIHTQTNGFCIQQYCGHSGSVNSIRFHPRFFKDATNLILTASGDCQAHIWQCVLSPINDSLESNSEVVLNYNKCYSFAMNQSNNLNHSMFSSGISSQLTHMHNNNSFQSPNNINSNYQELITNTPIIRSPIKRFEGHTDVCIAADWFPDGELLATASWDRSACVYNVETGKVLCTLQHDDILTNVNIHSSQKIILTSSKDTTFKVWDFRDPICSVNVYQGHNRSVNSAIFVNEDKIATSSDDQTVKLWDLRIMRSPVSTINTNSGVNRICTMNINGAQSNESLLCVPLDNRDVKIYNLRGERVMRMPRNNRIGHNRLVTSLTSYNNLLLSASFDKSINCWSIDNNQSKSSASSNSYKFSINNKENNGQESQSNTPLSQPGLIPNDSLIFYSAKKNNDSSPPQTKTNVSYSSTFHSPMTIPPLAHITNSSTNNNLKEQNMLSKLTDRIKI